MTTQRFEQDIFSTHSINSNPILMLAPMEGISNANFREEICALGAIDFIATEFVRISESKQKVKAFKRHPFPLQIQLMGNKAEAIANCIKFSKERGIILEQDWLDLNVGCPSKCVNAKGAGAALLLDPIKIVEITSAMRAVHKGPLSIKTRIGYENEKEFDELLNYFNDCPIDFLTLHARTRTMGLEGDINYKCLASAVNKLKIPVIGNGGIWTPEDAQAMLEKTGVRGLMCGRGAVANPFIFQDIRKLLKQGSKALNLNKDQRRSELKAFALGLLSKYQKLSNKKYNLIGTFKEFSYWFSKNPLIGAEYFEGIKRLQCFEEIERELQSTGGADLKDIEVKP